MIPGFVKDTPEGDLQELQIGLSVAGIFATALIVLVIGTPLPDDRLAVSGMPLSPVVFITAILLILFSRTCGSDLARTLVYLAPVALLSVTLLWSSNLEYGAFKLFNLLLSVSIAVPLFLACERKVGLRHWGQLWILASAILLVLAVIYKLQNGFFKRDVLFFMSGPIVFGRLMGIAAIISIFSLNGVARYFAYCIFSLAVLWTMSKGPLIALVLATILSVLWLMPRADRFRFLVGLTVLLLIVGIATWSELATMDWGRLAVISSLVTGNVFDAADSYGSLGVRLSLYLESLELLIRLPTGVGLGGWASAVSDNLGFVYPHNLLLELWAEGGLLLGTIALLPLCAFVFCGPPLLRASALFLFLAQMVSGDLLDGRYLLTFSLMCVLLPGAKNDSQGVVGSP